MPKSARKTSKSGASPSKPPKPLAAGPASKPDNEIEAFLRDLEHPMKREVLTLRGIILGASPQIREGVKWKSPSFRTTEFFATLNLRAGKILLILHSGAKLNKNSTDGMAIPDPGGLLKWLAKDRASVAFETATDVRGKKAGLTAILREWIRYV